MGRIRVQYEELEPVMTIDQAIRKESVHGKRKILKRYQNAEVIKKAVKEVVGSVNLGGQEHFYLEPHSALVVPSGENEELIVYFS